jgi:hypothetical protein
LSVAGRFPPVTVNPVPEIESELMVTAAVPLEVTVIGFVIAVPTETFPNASEVALRLSAGPPAFNCNAKLCDRVFILANSVAVCVVVTEATFAVNEAAATPAAITTLPGTVTALFVLASVTLIPPGGATEFSDTVHVVEPAPVNELLPHASALNVGNGPSAMDVDFVLDPSVAVNVMVCEDATANALAGKLALFAPDTTVTEAGTVSAPLLLLVRFTAIPFVGAASLSVTVQLSVPVPMMEAFAHFSDESEIAPLPCSFTAADRSIEETVLPAMLSCPVESVVDAGSY